MGIKLSKNICIWRERCGPLLKNKTVCEISEPPQCLICWEPIASVHSQCVVCKIRLHSECEKRYRETEKRNYCLCPHCKKVGTLALTLIKLPTDKITNE